MNQQKETLCDICGYREYKGIVVWGREPNAEEKRFNDTLEVEGKDYWCEYFSRYFNKSFEKHKYHCEAEQEIDDEDE